MFSFQNKLPMLTHVGGETYTQLEVNGRLTSSLNMIGAVMFVSNQQKASCHGSESNLKETCVMYMKRTAGKFCCICQWKYYLSTSCFPAKKIIYFCLAHLSAAHGVLLWSITIPCLLLFVVCCFKQHFQNHKLEFDEGLERCSLHEALVPYQFHSIQNLFPMAKNRKIVKTFFLLRNHKA